MDWNSILGAAVSDGTDLAVQATATAVSQNGTNTSAHIAAQNAVVAQFTTILNALHAGQITAAAAVTQISTFNHNFQVYVAQLGYGRAIRGGQDVQSLASSILNSIASDAAKAGTPVALPTTPGGLAPTQPTNLLSSLSSSLASMSPTTLALAGGALFLLMRKK